MRIEELAWVCQEAARELAGSSGRPFPPAVIVPGSPSTRIIRLPDFPDDDVERQQVLAAVATRDLVPTGAPAFGFVAEAEVDGVDAVVVVFAAQGHPPRISAAPITDDGALGSFGEGEALDPLAMPWLHPLQHAVETAPAPAGPN